MERLQKPQDRRERTGIVQIVLIAAVLLAALYGGLQLLGGTHAAWQQRQAERSEHAAAIRKAAEAAEQDRIAVATYEQQTALMRAAAERRKLFETGQMKCVSGTAFRKLPNGWENVPGARCPTPSTAR